MEHSDNSNPHDSTKTFLTLHGPSKWTDNSRVESRQDGLISARQRTSKAINASLNGDEVEAREELRQIASILDAELEGRDVE